MGKKIDVLFWAALKPIKNGTFEDYILKLAAACSSGNLSIKFVLRAPINPEVKHRFMHAGLDYELLEKVEHTNGRVLSMYLHRNKPRILHMHFYGATEHLVLWARITSKVKIIVHDHNSRPVNIISDSCGWRGIKRYVQFLKRSIFGLLIKKVVVVSRYLEKQIHYEMYLPSKKVQLIYNGVDTVRFHPAVGIENRQQVVSEVLNVLDDELVITYVGEFNDNKGVDILLEAIRKLSAEGLQAHFVIVGDGPMREQVEEAAEALGGNRLCYLGLRSDVDRILRASDMFVAPHKWEEAFGLTLIEAAASGLPVIASDVGAISEVIGEDEGGIRIKPNDVNSLCDAIKHLVEDGAYREKLGKLARKRAKRLFSLDTMVNKTIELYA